MVAAALALSAGTAAALAVGGTAHAEGSGFSGDGWFKTKWLVDSAPLATMNDVDNVIDSPAVWGKTDASGQRLTGKGVGVPVVRHELGAGPTA